MTVRTLPVRGPQQSAPHALSARRRHEGGSAEPVSSVLTPSAAADERAGEGGFRPHPAAAVKSRTRMVRFELLAS